MADMFDHVSPRYRLLNRLMTFGQDAAWRRAMWAAVPPSARVVLDLCTGDGSSLPGLRKPGRLVVGLDTSFGMLEQARDATHSTGWAPRLVCGDAFALPLRDGSVDAVTIAFGIRNLRPQAAALAELARVMSPGATLVVLEATAPERGWLAPFHRLWLRRVVPLLGRLSPDPSAYEYLGASILEFGAGSSFSTAAESLGFRWRGTRAFMLGATRLWVAAAPAAEATAVQSARAGETARGEMPTPFDAAPDQRLWNGIQCALAAALCGTLVWALIETFNPALDLPLDAPRRLMVRLLAGGGSVVFGARAIQFLLRTLRPAPRI